MQGKVPLKFFEKRKKILSVNSESGRKQFYEINSWVFFITFQTNRPLHGCHNALHPLLRDYS